MLDLLAFILATVAVIVVLQFLTGRTGLAAAALLTVAGRSMPFSRSEPDTGSACDPYLWYSAADLQSALYSPLLAIRKNLRVVVSLSTGGSATSSETPTLSSW